ncbi:MAG: SdrD B-like domain-containing protein, partial [Gammaproteobacteria bacterium]
MRLSGCRAESPRWRGGCIAVVLFFGLFVWQTPSTVHAVSVTDLIADFDNLNDTSGDYTARGDDASQGFPPGTDFSITFNSGAQNNAIVRAVIVGGQTFVPRERADLVMISRVSTNATGTNTAVTSTRQQVFYAGSVSGSNVQIQPSVVTVMEDVIGSNLIINKGVENVFDNTQNNIERMDWVWTAGVPAAPADADLDSRCFLVSERGGNNPHQVAAILSIDAAGSPTSYGPLTASGVYGPSGLSPTVVRLRSDPDTDAPIFPYDQVAGQEIRSQCYTFRELGIGVGQTFFGYSMFPTDVSAANDLLGLSNVPLDTVDASAGGDYYGGGEGVYVESTTPPDDNDGDGIADNVDVDDDNDGILDAVESGGLDTDADADGDGAPNFRDPDAPGFVDANNDGIDDRFDRDGDGVPNHFDIDADNDGIPDLIEAQGGVLTTAPSGQDGNGDGLDNAFGPGVTPVDTDGDTVPDYLDIDADNDGITDLVEGHDANGDGVADILPSGSDADGDGLDDNYDTIARGPPSAFTNSGGSNAPLPNTDGGGGPNYVDIDADDDGIPDNIESQPTVGYQPPSGLDDDDDGVDNVYDAADTNVDPVVSAGTAPQNTDNTDTADYVDLDSDNDALADVTEGGRGTPAGADTDNDGLDDGFDRVAGPALNNPNDDITAPATDLPDDDADVNAPGGDVDYRDIAQAATLSGTVFLDDNHNDLLDGDERTLVGWIVEAVDSQGNVVATATTDAGGNYQAGLPAGSYSVRFRHPETNVVWQRVDNVILPPGGAAVVNLPLDPQGLFYDSTTRQRAAGVQVQLTDTGGTPLPAACLLLDQQPQSTGSDGFYQFIVLAGAAPACPVAESEYRLEIMTFPPGFEQRLSTVVPPLSGALDATACTVAGTVVDANPGAPCEVQAQNTVPTQADSTPYYLAFALAPGDPDIVNNHISLDPNAGGPLLLGKRVNRSRASIGEQVIYTVRVDNTSPAALSNITLEDDLPAGFRFVENSAQLQRAGADGELGNADDVAVPITPTGADPVLFNGIDFAADESIRLTYFARIGSGVTQGDYVNRARPLSGSTLVGNVATATVTIEQDPIFEKTTIIGTVFSDGDGDGYQDPVRATGLTLSSEMFKAPVALRDVAGRSSAYDDIEDHTVVERVLIGDAPLSDLVLTSAEGTWMRLDAGSELHTRHRGLKARGMTGQDLTLERRIEQTAAGRELVVTVTNEAIAEAGLPGVRVATVRGLLIETDAYGRFHLADVDGGRFAQG